MKQFYRNANFRKSTLALIETINGVVDEYIAGGYTLTTRQVYYQLVARGFIENTQASYKKIAQTINDAKLAGLIDWDALEDRTRAFINRTRWDSPQQILNSAVKGYHEDLWDNQENRVFVIIEKEALVGVLQNTCYRRDVPLLAARGYPSGSVLREFAINQLLPAMYSGQTCHILHLGDHDPSGIDMTRDLTERLEMFTENYGSLYLKRIALNMDQVEEIKPPENPAKSTDARFDSYYQLYGESSWELDALSPEYLNKLVLTELDDLTDNEAYELTTARIESEQAKLQKIATRYEEIE